MLVLNKSDRFQLVIDAIDYTPELATHPGAARLRQEMVHMRQRHHEWIRLHGEDLPEVRDWRWHPEGNRP